MNTGKTIKKILFISMWMIIGGGMLVLLIAAMGKQKKNICTGLSISIHGVREDNCFLSRHDIMTLLKSSVKGEITGQAKSDFNLREMEDLLENNAWVKDAQLYFDNKDVLHVKVTERMPVARIFTARGKSFYIDGNEEGIPLSGNLSPRVPVFINVPDKEDRRQRDSLLLHHINATAMFISQHPFWRSQVAHVELVRRHEKGDWEFDMVPVVGNHVVRLGTGQDIDKKLDRLFVFYREVLSRTGFEKYKTIDVRFAGQVVAENNGKQTQRFQNNNN